MKMKMLAALVSEVHCSNASGHFGVRKTLGRLKQRVFWVGMQKDVCEWCKVCDVCCARMGPGRKTSCYFISISGRGTY